MNEAHSSVPEPLMTYLQSERVIILGTVDAETSGPATNAISWLYALDPNRIRFAVDQRSRTISNIKNNPRVSLTVFGGGSIHAIYGSAKVIAETLDDVPIKLSCIEITVEMVRDAMFYGARISMEPEYEKTYDKRAAEKLDNQVFTAMRKA